MGLFVAILSYHQTLTFGLLVDPKLVTNSWYLAACLQESFAELKEAAERARPESTNGATAPKPEKPAARRRVRATAGSGSSRNGGER
jgi:hypothetical protein